VPFSRSKILRYFAILGVPLCGQAHIDLLDTMLNASRNNGRGCFLLLLVSLYCRIVAVVEDPEAVLDPLNQATEEVQALEVR
jgi:hypothetical protein